MTRIAAKLAVLTALVVGSALVLFAYKDPHGERTKRVEAEHKTQQLERVVGRLSAERRVADIIVTDQRSEGDKLHTTLLFVEHAPDGSTLPARRFNVDGNVASVDGMAIQFDGKFVEESAPLRGRSVVLFTRLFGENQPPDKGFHIDPPNQIPDAYRGPDPVVTNFERDLWAKFWKLADDESYRNAVGVRVARGEAVATEFRPERLYTVTLESDGRLNITSAPLKGIYREAMKRDPRS